MVFNAGMISQWIVQIGLSALAVACYAVAMPFLSAVVARYGARQALIAKRVRYLQKLFRMTFAAVLAMALAIIWGIDFGEVVIFASSVFAVLGIALFASWSMLSNITAGMILLFSFPYKIGDSIRIVDGDLSIQGRIIDMTLFCVVLENQDGQRVAYPNNLAIQKPVVRLHSADDISSQH